MSNAVVNIILAIKDICKKVNFQKTISGEHQWNKIGKSFSYVNAIDSLVINLMSDFRLDDYLEDGTMDGVYSDLVDLRKKLISNNEIKIDVDNGIMELLVDEKIILERLKNYKPVLPEITSGYQKMYIDHVNQANKGADLDFLVGRRGTEVKRHSH